MSHPIPGYEYEDNNGKEPDIKSIEEEKLTDKEQAEVEKLEALEEDNEIVY